MSPGNNENESRRETLTGPGANEPAATPQSAAAEGARTNVAPKDESEGFMDYNGNSEQAAPDRDK